MTHPDEALWSDPPADPLEVFDRWHGAADACETIKYAHAMCLSTVEDGLPEARTVLMMLRDEAGFVFFTDADSPKGRHLDRSPPVALTFYWGPLDRQVRIRGTVEKASDEVSDRCFSSRPRPSQITAWASRQSRPQESRADLERRYEHYRKKFEGDETVPRPPHWQAYRVLPRAIELWQARAKRLHDRLHYARTDGGAWEIRRLDP